MTHTLKFILALLLLVGCQNEPIELDDNRPNPDGSIGFRLKLADSSIGSDSSKTKGTPHDDLAKYDSVCVKVYSHTADYETSDDVAFFQKVTLKPGTPNWVYTPPMFWPTGKKLSFMAYASDLAFLDAGISFMPATGVPDSIKYEVPSEVTKQPDLLVSAKLNEEENANKITLDMKHALACISFIGTSPDPGTYVKKIKLRNVYGKGTLALNDDTIVWKIDTDSKDFTVFEAGIKDTSELKDPPANNLMTANGYLMMIPQELTDAAIDVFYWDGTNETKSITYLLPTNDPSYATWKAGKKYIYKFSTQSEADITVVYYEKYAGGKYAGGKYGFQSKTPISLPGLNNTDEIIEAGYGVLTKGTASSDTPNISIGTNGKPIVSKKITTEGYNLYAVSQTSIDASATFELPATPAPVDVYFDDSDEACGKIIPHFAKGVVSDSDPTDYAIRTPQQMRNISALTTAAEENESKKKFNQERNLDFSVETVGGGTLTTPVVDQIFSGTYNGQNMSISKVKIEARTFDYVGLFSRAYGQINDIVLKSSSITGRDYVGGIIGQIYGDFGIIKNPQVIGTADTETEKVVITGRNNVGGIAGLNSIKITGSEKIDNATEITVATLSGWVTIKGVERVGGIAGHNAWGSIDQVLVNGVYVTGEKLGELTESRILISGEGGYVGGITGYNSVVIKGNVTGSGEFVKNMPDIAGIVEIRGDSCVGGIAGFNIAESGKLNSVNIRLGRTSPMVIYGSGNNVGGIVGENRGELGGESTNTFISTRGNINIEGADNVGGIVGKNTNTATLKNCFVYDFYTQGNGPKTFYSPTIKSRGNYAGGIAGNNSSSIENCSVFSANDTQDSPLSIEAANYVGGIVGFNEAKTMNCSLVGKVKINVKGNYSGGILGGNTAVATLEECWVGSTDKNEIIKKAGETLGLVITPPGVTDPSFGTPHITGENYIGGIAGLNAGIIEGITISDNVTIGREDGNPDVGKGSNWVGGIVGGNSPSEDGKTESIIRRCTVECAAGKIVTIQGSRNLGGIAGLNNGVVDDCHVLGPQDNPLKITGLGTIGGIVGQIGGHNLIGLEDPNNPGTMIFGTGNDHTKVINSTVSGYVTIQGSSNAGYTTAVEVGGIVGYVGPTKNTTNNVANCTVDGTTSNSISISVAGTAGGIAGKCAGNISACYVKNATIKSSNGYAGGITGYALAPALSFAGPSDYRSDFNDCRVYSTTTGSGEKNWGTLIGLLSTGGLTSTIIFGGTSQNYVSVGPAVGDIQTTGTVTVNCSIGPVP